MRAFGLFVSVVLHAGILAWAFISIGATKPVPPSDVKPINVEIITTAELTRLQQGVRDRKSKADAKATEKQRLKTEPKVKQAVKRAALPPRPQKELPAKPEAAKPEPSEPKIVPRPTPKPVPKPVVKKPEPPTKPTPDPIAKKLADEPKPVRRPAPKVAAKPEAKPEPKPAKKVAEKPKPAPKKVAETKPEPKPKPKPVAKKPAAKPKPKPAKKVARKPDPRASEKSRSRQRVSRLQKKFSDDDDSLAALLNNDATASDAPVRDAPRTRTPRPQRQAAVARRGTADGTDSVLTISEKQALVQSLRRQVESCWSPPTGAAGAEKLAVRMRISFRKDGSVVGAPQVLNPARSVFFLAASDSALRAVLECQPYSLPAELFEHWKLVDLNFDPKEMFGG